MNHADIFAQARQSVNRSKIESLLPGGQWKGNEYWVKNPLRDDKTEGSFSVSETGLYHDFSTADKGDIITLVSKMRRMSLFQAAEFIASKSVNDKQKPTEKKKNKPAAMFPQGPDTIFKIDKYTKSHWFKKTYGKITGIYQYSDIAGNPLYFTLRCEIGLGKNVIPLYQGIDEKIYMGNPVKAPRPLYNCHKIESAEKILIIEGEKCANVDVPGYVSITWPGGCGQVHLADLKLLKNKDVKIWPDADEAGLKAANYISKQIPGSLILDIKGKPQGWDIYDAVQEGIDIVEFIKEHTPKKQIEINDIPIETPGIRYWNNIQKHIEEKIKKINLPSYEINEDDAGRLFVDIHIEYFRFNTTSNGFMVWTEAHWTPDLWNLAERAAAGTAKIFQTKLVDINPPSLKEAAAFIKKIRSASGVRAILYFASSDPRIVTSQEDYDTNQDLLNTPGGTCELKTYKLREHRREDLITKITAYTPDPNHKPSYFLNFLKKITLSRDDLIESLQRFLGSGCSGKSPKDKIGVQWGEGQNGKTVLVESCGDALHDYTASLDIKSLSVGERQNAGHSDDIASLHGKRFCLSSESNQSIKLDEAKIKKYSGGDTIPVSFKHGHTFYMRPSFSLIILTNHKPRITGRDKGMWRRIIFFPYEYVIPDEEKDLDFKMKMLQSDGPYIMHWLIEGAQKWYDKGYGIFQTTEKATTAYKKEEDVIGSFIDECCEVAKGFSIPANRLRTAYQKWCTDNGEIIFSGKSWRQALEEHGFERKHGMSGKTWYGLTLIKTESGEECQGELI